MSLVLIYISQMLTYAGITAIIVCIFRLVYCKVKRINFNVYHETALVIFFAWIAGVASLTLGHNLAISPDISDKPQIYLKPFVFIIDYFKRIKYYGTADARFFIDLFGNIIAFMPIGFIIPLIWRVKRKNVILTGLSMSVFIEVFQLFTNRITDINDVILNTLGTFLGYLIYNYLHNNKKEFTDKFKTAHKM